ncbi:MAG: hypothetical protein R2701_09345 [Acidimicrobiales bacterium]
MDDDRDAGLVHPGPEGVEHRVAGRPLAVDGRGGGRTGDDGAGSALQRPLELGARPVDVHQREVRRGEDPILVGEAPVLVQPAVERGEQQLHGPGVVLERVLVDHPERREHPAALQALVVHRPQASVTVAVLGADRLVAAQQLERVVAVRVAAEVVGEDPGWGDGIERRVLHAAEDLATEHRIRALGDLRPLEHP